MKLPVHHFTKQVDQVDISPFVDSSNIIGAAYGGLMIKKIYGSNANLDSFTNIDLKISPSKREIPLLDDTQNYQTFITALDTYLKQPATMLTDQIDTNV